MKSQAVGAVIFACLSGFLSALPAMPARCIGTFPLMQTPAAAPAQALRAAAKAVQSGCERRIEVSALVNDSFSPASLSPYGWRLVSRLGDVATLEGCAASAGALGALPGIKYVKLASRVFPLMDSVRKVTHVDELHDPTRRGGIGRRLTGKGVLFGILDIEFDTHHPAFLDSSGATRFLALWDQTDTTRRLRSGFGYGVIKNHAQLLADSLFGLGSGEFHGTFTTSFGAGSDWKCPYYGEAPGVMIVGVKIGDGDQCIIDGLSWLSSLADSLKVPCVINMSLGLAEGPHDGTSLTDRAIDNFSKTPGRIVVGAAGNDGAKRTHIAFPVGGNGAQGTWLQPVQGTSATGRSEMFSGIDMWGDSGKSFAATFCVIDTARKTYRIGVPTILTAAKNLQFGAPKFFWVDSVTGKRDTLYFQDSAWSASPLNGRPHCKMAMLTLNPNLFLGVVVADSARTGGTVHAWNINKTALTGLQMPGFFDGDTVMSVNELGGTAKRNITVGATVCKTVFTLWNGREVAWNGGPNPQSDLGVHALAGSSGRGPTLDGRIKPDITAPGHDVVGAMPRNMPDNGLIAWPADTHSTGRYTSTGGTSVAAPIVAGIVALMLEANPQLTVEEVRGVIQATAITDAATGPITPATYNNSWGAGRVNAAGAIAKMLGLPLASRGGALPERQGTYALISLPGNRLQLVGDQRSGSGKIAIEFFSIDGRRILRQPLSSRGVVFCYSSLAQGIYFARATEKGKMLCSIMLTRLDQK